MWLPNFLEKDQISRPTETLLLSWYYLEEYAWSQWSIFGVSLELFGLLLLGSAFSLPPQQGMGWLKKLLQSVQGQFFFCFYLNRSVGMLLLAVLDFIVYSYNWIVGTALTCAGVIIWISFYLVIYLGKGPPGILGTAIVNYCLGIWVLPFLLYWNEKRIRQNVFLNWCNSKELSNWKKLLNNLPVGVLVYKHKKLNFASLAARKLLVGTLERNLASVASAVDTNEQLRNATVEPTALIGIESSTSEQGHLSNVHYTTPLGETKPLSVSSIILGLQDEPYNVCILQDQSLYAELEKEKATKEYTKKFFAMITHELRNPLQGLLGIFEGLLETFRGYGSEYEQCQMGVSTVKLMMRLVNDLLDLTQLETDKFKLSNSFVRIEDIVHECAELMQFKFKAKGVELVPQIIGPIPRIKCDPSRYKQIVLNLLGNSIKFTEKGSVTLTIEYDHTSHKLVTTVADTGVGVKPEDKSKLFTFFGKLEDQQALNPQGAGLGLYICKKLVEAMGGEISLESEYLKGTTIKFTIQSIPEELHENSNEISLVIQQNTQSRSEENIVETPLENYNLPYTFVPVKILTQTTRDMIITEPNVEQKPVLVVDDEFICARVLQTYLRGCGIDSDSVRLFCIQAILGYIWSKCAGACGREIEGRLKRLQSAVN
eukprot:TRINITY_DN88119_c1_g1_i1.p1 TRINITY_DN88119_c1_g1~~TRINITY_DN88119_c1_g1_i1.p1  ORF type:complete len:655 (-),score=42.72 TRINITY_DN88119_c1_g1_i1:391-2355(-)